MTAPPLDVLTGLYDAIVNDATITTSLGTYVGSPSVHTKRPVPNDAEFPMIVAGPMIDRSEIDAVSDFRPIVLIDLIVSGDQTKEYRTVESLADKLYAKFHRKPNSLTIANYSVVQIRASGPGVAAADSDERVARVVSLSIELYADG